MIIKMKTKQMYYIVSLVLFVIGIAVLGIHVNNYRKSEYYDNMVGVTGEDENVTVTGKIVATSGGHQLGNSFFPNLAGNITLVPGMQGNNKPGSIDLKADVNVDNRLLVGKTLCLGDTVNCINSDMLSNIVNSLQFTEGSSIRCKNDPNRSAVYRYSNGKRFHYTTGGVASRHDPNWRSAKEVDCSRITQGNPLL